MFVLNYEAIGEVCCGGFFCCLLCFVVVVFFGHVSPPSRVTLSDNTHPELSFLRCHCSVKMVIRGVPSLTGQYGMKRCQKSHIRGQNKNEIQKERLGLGGKTNDKHVEFQNQKTFSCGSSRKPVVVVVIIIFGLFFFIKCFSLCSLPPPKQPFFEQNTSNYRVFMAAGGGLFSSAVIRDICSL